MFAWSPPSVSQIRVVQYGWNEPERCVKRAILTYLKYSIGNIRNSSILSGFTVLLWLMSQRHTFQPDRLCVETVFDDQIHFGQRQKYKITNTILKTFCKLHILIAHCTNFIAHCTNFGHIVNTFLEDDVNHSRCTRCLQMIKITIKSWTMIELK